MAQKHQYRSSGKSEILEAVIGRDERGGEGVP